MAKIRYEDLAAVREKHARQTIVFCSGVFDITHAGHVLFFEDAKRQGDILVAMVGSDKTVKRDKGPSKPILNEHQRLKMVDSLKPVDYTLTDELVPATKHPLYYIDMVFEKLRPDVYVVNQDAFDMPYRKEMVKRFGTKLVALERTAPPEFGKVSTSSIIKKIKELG